MRTTVISCPCLVSIRGQLRTCSGSSLTQKLRLPASPLSDVTHHHHGRGEQHLKSLAQMSHVTCSELVPRPCVGLSDCALPWCRGKLLGLRLVRSISDACGPNMDPANPSNGTEPPGRAHASSSTQGLAQKTLSQSAGGSGTCPKHSLLAEPWWPGVTAAGSQEPIQAAAPAHGLLLGVPSPQRDGHFHQPRLPPERDPQYAVARRAAAAG